MGGKRKNEAQKSNRKRTKYPPHQMKLRSNRALSSKNEHLLKGKIDKQVHDKLHSSENWSGNEEANISHLELLPTIYHKGASSSKRPDVYEENHNTKIKEMGFLIDKEIDERSKNEHLLKGKIDKPIHDKLYSSENWFGNEEANISHSVEVPLIYHEGASSSKRPDVYKENHNTKIKEMGFLINKEIDERSKNEHLLKGKIDKPIHDKLYREAVVNEETVKVGNFVSFKTEVGKIMYLFCNDSKLMAHVQLYWQSSRTILGDLGNEKEIFLLNLCQNIDISTIEKVLKVHEIDLPGFEDFKANNNNNKKNNAYDGEFDLYNKLRYNIESGKFDYRLPETFLPKNSLGYCPSCKIINNELKKKEIQEGYNICNLATKKYFENVFRDNQEYRVGTCIYFIENKDNKYGFEGAGNEDTRSQSFETTCQHVLSKKKSTLFSIGLVEHIFFDETDQDFKAQIKRFYRNEDVPVKPLKTGTNIHLLYASEEEVTITFSDIKGICYVAFTKNILKGNIENWLEKGPDRFHFTEQLDKSGKISSDINEAFKALKDDSYFENGLYVSVPPVWPEIEKSLVTLDLFCGAGGLSHGLKISGVSDVDWAVDRDSAACMSYRANNGLCREVINKDLNEVLKRTKDLKDEEQLVNLGFPKKHEVGMICGGPPCQGFSLLNRHREGEETEKKNKLIGVMLIFVNHYRPRFVVLENVPNFFSLKQGYYFKETLQSLINIGYQVNFGVLEAGCFGVPQIRKRAFLIAAAPGEILPDFPKALHAIDKARTWQRIDIDNKKYVLETYKCMTEFAPLRPYHVEDAISDLKNCDINTEKAQQYKLEPQTCYQEKMREMQDVLTNHVWDIPNDSLNQIKIDSIPINECEEDARQTVSLTNICSTKDRCLDNESSRGESSEQNITEMQDVETANGNHQWSSICTRLQWDGFFETITTNVSHTSLQGSYIHPDENRLVSLREVARAQGFPDYFELHGSIKDKKNQLGNAVPAPLAYAIGQEIKLSMARKERGDYLHNKNSYFYSRF